MSNTTNFVNVVLDETNDFTDGPRLRVALKSFTPAIKLTSDDFNQMTVSSTVGSSSGASPAIPNSTRTAAQQREDLLLGNVPQTAAATKRTTEAATVQLLAVICRHDYDHWTRSSLLPGMFLHPEPTL